MPEGKVDNIVVSMELKVSGGQDVDALLWGFITTNDLSAVGESWIDNVKARWASLPENANYKISLNPGSIRFFGRNLYYSDQTYVYQGAQLILEQDDSEAVLEPPPTMINWKKINENRYKIEVEYPLISGENSSVSSSGSESIALARKGDINRNGLTENFTLFVETDYENAWANYFNEVVSKMPPDLVDNDSAGIDNGNPYLSVGSENNLIEYSVRAENIKAVI